MNILIATDGSEFSQKAVEKCCEFLRNGKQTNFKIISVVEQTVPISAEPFGASNEYYANIQSELIKKAHLSIDEAEKILSDRCGNENVSIQTEVFKGPVKQTIVDEARSFGADLIVVGSHGYGFIDRALLGSISDFVIHHAPCSVLVVRTKEERT